MINRRRLVWVGAIALVGVAASLSVRLISHFDGAAASQEAGPPPLAGTVANFTPFDAPRPAPQIAMTDGTGARVDLASLKGKPVLLNLWATWCVPCVREMPSLDRLQQSLDGRIRVVALSQDKDGAAAVQPFFAAKKISHLATYLDQGGDAARALGVDGLPTTYLLDGEGRLLGELLGPAEWDSPEALALIRHYLPAE
jgi:thiol-disulfide isomerase/thioredoxin